MTLPLIPYSGGGYHWAYLPVDAQTIGEPVGQAITRTLHTYGGTITAGVWSPPGASPYLLPTWASVSGNHTDPAQETLAGQLPPIIIGMNDTRLPFSVDDRIVATNSGTTSPRAFSYSTVSSGPSIVGLGATSETGTVTVYQYNWITTILGYNVISGVGVIPQVYQYTTETVTSAMLVIYMPVAFDVNPNPTPAPITLQIKQNQDGSYTPQTAGILPKYDGVPVRQIKANFGIARIGVVKPAINGGFLLYEEIGNAPSGTVYVYDNTRAFVVAVPAAQIGQYLA